VAGRAAAETTPPRSRRRDHAAETTPPARRATAIGRSGG